MVESHSIKQQKLMEVADKLGTIAAKLESDEWLRFREMFANLMSSELTVAGANRLLERVDALTTLT